MYVRKIDEVLIYFKLQSIPHNLLFIVQCCNKVLYNYTFITVVLTLLLKYVV